MRQIELLAPAKNLDAAIAAIDHGADAVYIGASLFGARAAASNSVEDIAKAVQYAHQYGAKLYVTLNTVIYDDEIESARSQAEEIVAAGADALIIQDMAYARMGLNIDLHASTQMCNVTLEDFQFLEDCGFSRAVLERNLSYEQIKQIASSTNIELECFVHGAVCVGLSGRCYLSRASSARSGNRGECTQACRLSYDLLGGDGRKIIQGKHLLSVRDLNLSERLGDLLDLGVSSFKIEGRLKDLSYTKNIVSYYRRALDEALKERKHLCRSSEGKSYFEFEPNPSKSFSRASSIYMFDGGQKEMASLESPKAMGESLGQVSEIGTKGFFIDSEAQLSTADGLCFLSNGHLIGGNVNFVQRRGKTWYVELNNNPKVKKGTKIFRNFDRKFENSLSASRSRRVVEVDGQIESNSERVSLTYRDSRGFTASAQLTGEFELTRNPDKMLSIIGEQLSKSGETIFEVRDIDTRSWQGEFISSGQLAALRREALAALYERRQEFVDEQARRPFKENTAAKYPSKIIKREVPICNELARQFYLDHGVESFEESLECRTKHADEVLLESAYCIRREIGECLREGSHLKEELFLQRGETNYKLEFDCANCRMRLILKLL